MSIVKGSNESDAEDIIESPCICQRHEPEKECGKHTDACSNSYEASIGPITACQACHNCGQHKKHLSSFAEN